MNEKTAIDYLSMPFNVAANTLSSLSELLNETRLRTDKIYNLIKHLHTCHNHPCDHLYAGIEVTNNLKAHNDPLFSDPSNVNRSNDLLPHFILNIAVNSLTREYSHSVDCDNNNLIFGKDFIFSISDEEVPKILFALQRMQNADLSIKRLTWQDFLSTIPDNTFV